MITKENIDLFLYTVKEYKRFSDYFSLKDNYELTDSYTEKEYIAIQTKLILLRKYGSNNEAVNVRDIAKFVKDNRSDLEHEMTKIISDFDRVQTNQIRTILSDGTELNLYKTIENVMYGLYLHADKDTIENIKHINEHLLFLVSRQYVQEFEKIIMQLYNYLIEKGFQVEEVQDIQRASMVFLGNDESNQQGITKSPYWANLYGNDVGDEQILEIVKETNIEELSILAISSCFFEEIVKDDFSETSLRKLVSPVTYSDWGDFSEAHTHINAIPNLGMSSKVRFNDRHDIAYVNFYENVEGSFMIDKPHIIGEGIHVLSLVYDSDAQKWEIYSFGAKLNDYLI